MVRLVRFNDTQRVRHFSDDGLEPEEYLIRGRRKRLVLASPDSDTCPKKVKLCSILRSPSPPILKTTIPKKSTEKLDSFVESLVAEMENKERDWHTSDSDFKRRLILCAEEVLNHGRNKKYTRKGRSFGSNLFEKEFLEANVDEMDAEFVALKQLHISVLIGVQI